MDARNLPSVDLSTATLAEIPCDSPNLSATLSADQVCQEYAPRVYRVVRRMVNSDTDAEDVTQEVLLQVVRKISEFRGDSSFATWLHRVAVNAALAHRRRQAIAQEHGLRNTLDVYGEGEPPSLTQGRFVTPDDQMMSRETTRLIESAISELPAVYRDVFVLSEVEGLPNADIAEQLGMSLAAVKSRLHRARAMLREVLAPHFEEVAV